MDKVLKFALVLFGFIGAVVLSGRAEAQTPPDTLVQIIIQNSSSVDRDFVSFNPDRFTTQTIGPNADPLLAGNNDIIYQISAFGASGTLEYADCVLQYDVQNFFPVIGTAGPKCTFTAFPSFVTGGFAIITLELTN